MEKNELTIPQVFAVTNVEMCLSAFTDNPDYFFDKMIALIDEHKLSENKEIMNYLFGLLARKEMPVYIEEFAKKYMMQSEKS
jgi:hypothetical protein